MMLTHFLPRNVCPVCLCSERAGGQAEHEPPSPGFWARCAQCGLLYQTPAQRMSRDIVYLEDAGCLPPNATYDPQEAKISRVLAGDVLPWVHQYARLLAMLPASLPRGTWLELGCGGGELMEHAASQGWRRVVGTEIGRDYVAFGRARKRDVRYCDVSTTSPFEDLAGACDVVVANEVFEHVADPRAFTRGAAAYLAPHGVFWATFAHAQGCPRMSGGEWHYWTPAAVDTVLTQAGLRLTRLDTGGSGYFVTATRAPDDPARDRREAAALDALTAQTDWAARARATRDAAEVLDLVYKSLRWTSGENTNDPLVALQRGTAATDGLVMVYLWLLDLSGHAHGRGVPLQAPCGMYHQMVEVDGLGVVDVAHRVVYRRPDGDPATVADLRAHPEWVALAGDPWRDAQGRDMRVFFGAT